MALANKIVIGKPPKGPMDDLPDDPGPGPYDPTDPDEGGTDPDPDDDTDTDLPDPDDTDTDEDSFRSSAQMSADTTGAICDCQVALFKSIREVEAACSLYFQDEIDKSNRAYEKAVRAADKLVTKINRLHQAQVDELNWHTSNDEDPLLYQQPTTRGHARAVGTLFDLPWTDSVYRWEEVQDRIFSIGLYGHLELIIQDINSLRASAREFYRSLEHAIPATESGRLYEYLSSTLDPSYAERVSSELICGLNKVLSDTKDAAAAQRAVGFAAVSFKKTRC